MSIRRLLYVIGAVVAGVGVAMLSAAVVALLYQEWDDAWQIAAAAAVTIAVGLFAWRSFGQRTKELSPREGFAAVGLSWFAIIAVGTLPYIFSGSITDVTDAFFETSAGFTTTGSSILTDPGALSHGILFWRALTQWMGGMGIIVLSVAILPLLGVGGVQLAKAESPGPTPDRLTPRFRETAKRLWFVYLGITAAEVLALLLGDMTLFESVAHSFTTMSTGGFGTDAASIGGFSAYTQWVVVVFMLLAGVSFALHFKALRHPRAYLRSAELRIYLWVLVAAAVVMIIGTRGGAVSDTIREGVFTAVSLVTTTGFATADFGQWAAALQVLVVGLMFIGGMAGSTAGSVKIPRHGVLVSASRNDLRRLIHPRGVFVARLGKDAVSEEIVQSVQAFFLMYMFIFMTGTFLFSIIDSSTGAGLDLVTSASATASAIGNIGPGLSEVGPGANYAGVPMLGKWLLGFLMVVGRLEIFPVVLLFTRELWRK
ncbi:MAG: TrkH family potassium uptake protein [Acidimicrobiia bacterium]|nr:TrkH family potassium uptake protein [Acidimicrobiia bacterium]MDH3469825.1 TrkH family potassium uptake protein [Acidimicrobiia bacterium]